MKNLRSQNKVKAEGGMSSMTDLVFLLLIFFIVLSTMVDPPNIELNLPSSNPPPPDADKKEVLKISVSENNEFFIGKEAKKINREDLEAEIMSYIALTKDSIVELSGDQTSNWQSNVAIIDIAKKNHLKLVIKTKY